jgi:N-acetylmuramoyl-L-alanine amidase
MDLRNLRLFQRGPSWFKFLPILFLLVSGELSPVSGAENLGSPPGGALSLDEALAALGGPPGGASARGGAQRGANPAPAGSAEFRWDPFFGAGVFDTAGHQLSFRAGEPGERGFFLVDGKDLYPAPVPYLVRDLLYFPEEFVRLAEQALYPAPAAPPAVENSPSFRIAAIIVDPGHGGKDPGAVGKFTRNGAAWSSIEKEITLKVSKEIHALLARTYPDKRVLLTRDRDVFPSLQARVDLANSIPQGEHEAVIFVSIHANASLNKHVRGFEVWYLDPNYRRELIDKSKYGESAIIVNSMMEEEFTTESILMGQNILNRMGEALGDLVPNRGLKAEKWFVVKNAQMPAVLVELAFVTNQRDAEIMADDGYLKKFATAIYKGITDFVGTFERTGGFTVIQ